MVKLFLPIILIGAAAVLFMFYTNPTYQTIKDLSLQQDSYNSALDKAQELHTLRDQLLAKRNSFSNDSLDKLHHVLPDNVDNIRLIIDINNIASRHNLALNNVDLGTLSGATQSASAQSAIEGNASAVGSVDVGFSVSTGNYDDFLAFLQDLEHSLRIVDVQKITFQTGSNNITNYIMTVRTYWLH
jgi:Tfp pilus assembly protein PilO